MEAQKYTSPKGTFMFPTMLVNPDKKFANQDDPFDGGHYKAKIRCSLSDPEVVKFLERLQNIHAAHVAEVQKESKSNKPIKVQDTNLAWEALYDEQGQKVDGVVVFKAKTRALFKKKDGTAGVNRVVLFDGAGNRLPTEDYNPGPGSVGRIAGAIHCWHNNALGCGLTLWIDAAQIVEYKEDTYAPANAEGFGFCQDGEAMVESPPFEADAATSASDL